jgi:hypothetical protein
MKARHVLASALIPIASLCYPVVASADAYAFTAVGERLEFMPQAEKGYVITLTERACSRLAAGAFWTGLSDDVRVYDRAVKLYSRGHGGQS